jgi:hypothetical protein
MLLLQLVRSRFCASLLRQALMVLLLALLQPSVPSSV